MRPRTSTTRQLSLGATALAGLLGASLLGLAPAQAVPAPTPAFGHETAQCEVTDSTLSWGVKESFRAYIDGIAKGSWTVEGATYATPEFSWTGAGTVSNHGDTASIAHTGQVHFEGHEGVLQLFISNPTLEIVSADEAYLRLDMKSTTVDGTDGPAEEQVRAIELDTAGRLSADGTTLTLDAAPAKLTPEGAVAFASFYPDYEEMDPVSLTGKTSCTFEAGALPEPSPSETPQAQDGVDAFPNADAESAPDAADTDGGTTAPAETGGIPVLPVVIGAIAAAVILGVGILLISGARRRPDASAESEDAQIDAAQQPGTDGPSDDEQPRP